MGSRPSNDCSGSQDLTLQRGSSAGSRPRRRRSATGQGVRRCWLPALLGSFNLVPDPHGPRDGADLVVVGHIPTDC
jgi:hypothetical protein